MAVSTNISNKYKEWIIARVVHGVSVHSKEQSCLNVALRNRKGFPEKDFQKRISRKGFPDEYFQERILLLTFPILHFCETMWDWTGLQGGDHSLTPMLTPLSKTDNDAAIKTENDFTYEYEFWRCCGRTRNLPVLDWIGFRGPAFGMWSEYFFSKLCQKMDSNGATGFKWLPFSGDRHQWGCA